MDPNADELRKEIEYSYSIESVSKTEIKLKFKFEEPLSIVPADKIFIRLDFGDFEYGIEDKIEIEQSMSQQLPKGGLPELKQIAETV